MSLTEINELSYFDFTIYVKLIYNREEAIRNLQEAEANNT